MITIPEAMLHRQTDHGQVQFVGEASSIGLKPGEWPQELHMITPAGEVFTFQRSRKVGHDEIVAMVYIEFNSGDYWQLHILND